MIVNLSYKVILLDMSKHIPPPNHIGIPTNKNPAFTSGLKHKSSITFLLPGL